MNQNTNQNQQPKLLESLAEAHMKVSKLTTAMVDQHALAIQEVKACHTVIAEKDRLLGEKDERIKALESQVPKKKR